MCLDVEKLIAAQAIAHCQNSIKASIHSTGVISQVSIQGAVLPPARSISLLLTPTHTHSTRGGYCLPLLPLLRQATAPSSLQVSEIFMTAVITPTYLLAARSPPPLHWVTSCLCLNFLQDDAEPQTLGILNGCFKRSKSLHANIYLVNICVYRCICSFTTNKLKLASKQRTPAPSFKSHQQNSRLVTTATLTHMEIFVICITDFSWHFSANGGSAPSHNNTVFYLPSTKLSYLSHGCFPFLYLTLAKINALNLKDSLSEGGFSSHDHHFVAFLTGSIDLINYNFRSESPNGEQI